MMVVAFDYSGVFLLGVAGLAVSITWLSPLLFGRPLGWLFTAVYAFSRDKHHGGFIGFVVNILATWSNYQTITCYYPTLIALGSTFTILCWCLLS